MKCWNTSRMTASPSRRCCERLRPGGRIALFVPNRGYPFETHGIYWRGRYRFRQYPAGELPAASLARPPGAACAHLLTRRPGAPVCGLPVRFVKRTVIFGAYDNIIARRPWVGKCLRALLQMLEKTPLRIFGLSHFWVIEKTRQFLNFTRLAGENRKSHPGKARPVRRPGKPAGRPGPPAGAARTPGSGRDPAWLRPGALFAGSLPSACARTNTLGVTCHRLPVHCARPSIQTSNPTGRVRLSSPSRK